MKEAESLKDLLDTEIKILNESVAESDEFKLKGIYCTLMFFSFIYY